MQPLEDLISLFKKISFQSFEVKKFNFINKTVEEFWTFQESNTFKGIYIYLDLSREDITKIIYVGKAGYLKKHHQTVTIRTASYFYTKTSSSIAPLISEKVFKFKKVNRDVSKDDLTMKKDDFAMIAIQIMEDNIISPELLESYLLAKLWKENGYFPKLNNKI